MSSDVMLLAGRVERLERSLGRTRVIATVAGLALAITWLSGARFQAGQHTVRAKAFIVEDAKGRERIVLGAPMPDGRQYVGMKILNEDGAEQFGLGLKLDGSVSMGFDAKPGVGDQRNRERLNLGVTASGQGWIRYLDNRTRARLRVALDTADAPSVQLLHWPDEQRILVRQLGFPGDTLLEWKR
jgi:hypothetical protein